MSPKSIGLGEEMGAGWEWGAEVCARQRRDYLGRGLPGEDINGEEEELG